MKFQKELNVWSLKPMQLLCPWQSLGLTQFYISVHDKINSSLAKINTLERCYMYNLLTWERTQEFFNYCGSVLMWEGCNSSVQASLFVIFKGKNQKALHLGSWGSCTTNSNLTLSKYYSTLETYLQLVKRTV